MGDEKKKHKRRPPKGPPKPRSVGVSNRNKDVNQWKEHVMKDCINEYYRELAANNNIPEAVNKATIAKKIWNQPINPASLHI